MSKTKTYHQGKFKPINPTKYLGDPTNIIYRSSWERQCMIYFDNNPNIIQWGSEEVVIPYRSPLDKRVHRYFVDFVVKAKTKDGKEHSLQKYKKEKLVNT